VVVSLFVVVSHIKSVTTTLRLFDRAGLDHFNVFVEANRLTLGDVRGREFTRTRALVLPGARSAVLLGEWGSTVAVLLLDDIDARVVAGRGGSGLTSRLVAVVNAVLDVDLSFSVPLERFTISVAVVAGALYVNLDAILVAANSSVLLVFVDTNLLFRRTVAVLLGDADLLAGDAFRRWSVVPSSALDSNTVLSLDLGGLGGFLVLVCRREDAERHRDSSVEIQFGGWCLT